MEANGKGALLSKGSGRPGMCPSFSKTDLDPFQMTKEKL